MPTGRAKPPRRPPEASQVPFARSLPVRLDGDEERRLLQEEAAIQVDAPIPTLFRPYPVIWLRAMAKALGLHITGRQDRAVVISHALQQPELLATVVAGLSDEARLALTLLLGSGGWSYYDLIAYRVGDEQGDRFEWDRVPPHSPLGELRLHGLLVVGSWQRRGVWLKVAVVPKVLRALLAPLLADVVAEPALPTPPEPGLPLVLHWASGCYEILGERAVIPEAIMINTLTTLAKGGVVPAELVSAWDDLDDLHHFLVEQAPGVRRLEDLRPVHLRQWVEGAMHFMEQRGGSGQLLQEMLHRVDGLLRTAAQLDAIEPDRLTELRAALKSRPSPRPASRRVSPSARPTPPRTKAEKPPQRAQVQGAMIPPAFHFSQDEVRIVLTWGHAFNANWQRLRRATAIVPSGPAKARLAARLERLEPAILSLVVESTPAAAVAEACQWFYTDRMADDEA